MIPIDDTEKKEDIYQRENDQIKSILVRVWAKYT